MNGVVVLWHQYVPHGVSEFYRNHFDYFLKWLEDWQDEFDHLHLVDSNWDFTQKDRDNLTRIMGDRYTIHPFGDGHQWTHFKRIVPLLTEENILLLDNDFYPYKKGLIKKAFDQLENGKKVVSMFDGSGGMEDVLWKKFPYLKEKGYRRLSPPFIFIKRELLADANFDPIYYDEGTYIPELDYTTKKGAWLDAFGLAMVKVLNQIKEEEIEFIPNDFSTLFLYDDDSIKEDIRPEHGCGYYHLRNSSLGFSLANERIKGREPDSSYMWRFNITPRIEATRLLAWAWILCGNDQAFRLALWDVVSDYGVSEEKWLEYITKFMAFHPWAK